MLISNWRRVMKHAWSVRLIILAGVLAGLEGLLPMLPALAPMISVQWLAAITFFVICGALIARFVVQLKVSGGDDAEGDS